jgi:hypothetical protein
MRTPRHHPCLPGTILAILAFAASAPAQPPETFSESLVVREREILVDLPDSVEDDRLHPEDFQVLVDGRPREVTRVEPLSAAGGSAPWTFIIYIDRILARPGTIYYSGLALSRRARTLTSLGTVEVAVAGSDPASVLAPTRDSLPVADTLTALAAEARVERDRTDGRGRLRGEPSDSQLRHQLDELLAFLSSRRPSGPHAVFIISDGFDLPPEQIALLQSESSAGSSEAPAEIVRRTARGLAAYGWVAIPIPLRKEVLGIETTAQSEIEILRQGAAPSDHQNSLPPTLPGRPPGKTTLSFPGVIELFIEPKTAALRAFAQATAGTVIGYEVQLDAALDALSRRWRLWIAEPDAPVEGLHRIAVSLPGLRKEVRAPAWLRSYAP